MTARAAKPKESPAVLASERASNIVMQTWKQTGALAAFFVTLWVLFGYAVMPSILRESAKEFATKADVLQANTSLETRMRDLGDRLKEVQAQMATRDHFAALKEKIDTVEKKADKIESRQEQFERDARGGK